MQGTSSFTPVEAVAPAQSAGWRPSLYGALSAAAFAIPLSLGSAALVFSRVAPELLASGVFAVMAALVWMNLATAGSARPVVFSARFFESTTLAAMMEQVIVQLPAWGLQDTRGVRLAFLCLIGGVAGLWVGALYLTKADRFTRYIPAPVFAGFSNSIAVALVVSQSQALWGLLGPAGAALPVVSISVIVLCTGLAVRHWRPTWPAAAIGLAVGVLAGLAWSAAGRHEPTVASTASMVMPVMLADFSALWAPGVDVWGLAGSIATKASILGFMIFINTTLAAQLMTQSDERRRSEAARSSLWMAGTLALAGATGSAPVSGSAQASASASRSTALSARLLVLCALAMAAVYLSGVLMLLPMAALCGALLCEAWFMIDRGSARHMGDWLRGRLTQANAREDLALVAAVTAAAVFFNMVTAVFVGLLLGLVLFAARNARKPVRNIWTGEHLQSNCARARSDMQLLARHGHEIRIFELEGDLFFGSADQLEVGLRRNLENTSCAIIDWSRVRHTDTSVAQAMAKVQRHADKRSIPLLHAGADIQGGNVGPVLQRVLPTGTFVEDLDHALELAENQLLRMRGSDAPREVTSMMEALTLFQGLSEAQRAMIEAAMEHKLFKAGQPIITAGEPADELMLLLHGSASILVPTENQRNVRLAGVRRGATIGEIGFLDQSTRSASVVAQEDTTVAVLRRASYDALCASDPGLVRQLLANIALDMATRLRHTNKLAIARSRNH